MLEMPMETAYFAGLFAQGDVAQLGERLHGMQEVGGSIPLVSTILLINLWKSVMVFAKPAGSGG